MGKVAGSFYKLVVDREAARLTRFFLNAGGLYVIVTIIRATNVWLSELLALRWRGRLTSLVQVGQKHGHAFLSSGGDGHYRTTSSGAEHVFLGAVSPGEVLSESGVLLAHRPGAPPRSNINNSGIDSTFVGARGGRNLSCCSRHSAA